MSNDAAILGRFLREISGTCRECGCHGDTCSVRTGGGDRCFWMDDLRTLCSNDSCVIAAARKQKKHKREARRKSRVLRTVLAR